jgi:hypothetical protein
VPEKLEAELREKPKEIEGFKGKRGGADDAGITNPSSHAGLAPQQNHHDEDLDMRGCPL